MLLQLWNDVVSTRDIHHWWSLLWYYMIQYCKGHQQALQWMVPPNGHLCWSKHVMNFTSWHRSHQSSQCPCGLSLHTKSEIEVIGIFLGCGISMKKVYGLLVKDVSSSKLHIPKQWASSGTVMHIVLGACDPPQALYQCHFHPQPCLHKQTFHRMRLGHSSQALDNVKLHTICCVIYPWYWLQWMPMSTKEVDKWW